MVGQVILAVAIRDVPAHHVERLRRHPRRIGTHISDKTGRARIAQLDAFVQALGDLHRARGREVQLARRLLLQARSNKRRRRAALDLLALDALDGERQLLAGRYHLTGFLFGKLVVLVVDALAGVAKELGLELRRILALQQGIEGPVLLGAEGLALLLALDDYPQRDRLDASGADAAFDLIPENRADAVSDQAVQHATGLLRIEEGAVELGRMLDRLFYAILGDFMEQDALDLAIEALAQAVGDMEGDRLALAIRVGGEVDMVLALGLLLYILDDLGLARNDVVFGLEVMLDIDAEGALGQIDDMADRGGHHSSWPRGIA